MQKLEKRWPLSPELPAAADTKKRRVLLMYISEVSGHHQATIAIERALKQLDPLLETMNINGFRFAYPILEKVINKAYMGVIKRTPRVWDYLYDNPRFAKRTRRLKEFLQRAKHPKFSRLLNEFQPDTIVCTQAFPCSMIADLKSKRNIPIRLTGVLTDFAPHQYWVHSGVDCYVVPSLEAKERFVKEGVSPEAIKVLGIPVDPKFSKALNKEALTRKWGLNPDQATLLLMGGGHGLGPIKDIVKSLLRDPMPFQLIILAGRNIRLQKWLKRISPHTSKKMLVFAFSPHVEEFMEMADMVITKPGGITTAEALCKGLPMIIVNPIPGQEEFNTNFLLNQGIAVRVDHVAETAKVVSALLKSPEKIKAMSQAALICSRPQASLEIAQLILS